MRDSSSDLLPEAYEGLRTLQRQFDTYQQAAFPERPSHFFSLELCGEAGELANLEKKVWKGRDIPEDHFCDTGTQYITNSWMTVVRAPDGTDPEGEPLLVNFSTDYGWMNGSNKSSEGIDTTAFTANADNAENFDISYTSNYPDDSEFTGTLFNMALDGIDIGESIDDVYFISDGTDDNTTKNYGTVSITRRL